MGKTAGILGTINSIQVLSRASYHYPSTLMQYATSSIFLILLHLIFPLWVISEPPRIGAILPLTGEVAPLGAAIRRGIEQNNSALGTLKFEDDACQPQRALTAFRRLREDGIRLFLGPCCTTGMGAIAPLLEREDALAMNVCTGSERMWDLSHGRVFHPSYSNQEESRFNATQMWQHGIKKVVIVFMEHEFARAHEVAFKEAFPGEVLRSLWYTGSDFEQLKNIILKLRNLQFDAIYVPIIEPFFLGFLSEAAKQRVDLKQVWSIYAFQLPEIMQREGKHTEGVIYSYPDISEDIPAAEYFAMTAANLFGVAVKKCGNDIQCVKKRTFSNRQI